VLLCLAILPYLNSLEAGFVYDDSGLVVGHETVQAPFAVLPLVSAPYWGEDRREDTALWRPVTTLSFGVDDALFDDSARWMHAVNVGLHAIVVLLGFTLAQRLGATREVAVITAALFAVHPLHTEAVTWVSGRAELYAALWVLVALLATASRGLRRPLLCGVATFLAVGSKESAAFLPVAVAAVALTRGEPLRRTAALAGASLIGVLAYVGLRLAALGTLGGPVARVTENPMVGTQLLERLPTVMDLAGRYVGLILWPHPLSIDYSPPALGLADGLTAYGALGLASLLALSALALIRPRDVLGRAAFLTLGAYAVASNLAVVIGTHFAERLFYLPSYFILLLLSTALARSGALETPARRRLTLTLLVAALLVAGTATWDRNADYRNDLTLAEATLEHSPNAAKASYNRARELQRAGRPGEALEQALHTLTLQPEDAWARIIRTDSLVALGRPGDAESLLRADLATTPHGHLERARLLVLLDERGATAEADALIEEALTLGANRPPWSARGADAAQRRGDYALAAERWQDVTRRTPESAYAWGELARSLLASGAPTRAREAFERSFRLAPTDPEAANGLAWTLLATGDESARAVALAQFAVGVEPRPDFLDTAARALAAAGRCPEAREQARRAAAQDPDYAETQAAVEQRCQSRPD